MTTQPRNDGNSGVRKEPEKKHPYLFYWLTGGLAAIIPPIIAVALTYSPSKPGGPTLGYASAGSSPSFTQPTGITGTASQAQLQQALLPAQELGSAAKIANSGTDLSHLVGTCGVPIPGRAQLIAYELLQDRQTGQEIQETIIEWDNSTTAGNAVSSGRSAIEQTGSCSVSSGGTTEELKAVNSGAPPPECAGGQYLAARESASSTSISGYRAGAQCGSFTITIEILSKGTGGAISQEVGDGYLNTAAARLEKMVG
jgi:hypothetical protein